MSIRNIVICLIKNGENLFVAEGREESKNETYYRPLGGGIKFGELAKDAAIREFREEMDTEIEVISYLHTFENIFTFDGEKRHQFVTLLSAEFKDKSIYSVDKHECDEEGTAFEAKWINVADFHSGRKILYPKGLSEFLQQA